MSSKDALEARYCTTLHSIFYEAYRAVLRGTAKHGHGLAQQPCCNVEKVNPSQSSLERGLPSTTSYPVDLNTLLSTFQAAQATAAATVIMAALHTDKAANVNFSDAGSDSPNGSKVFDTSISNVPEKFRGTDADRKDMSVLGKKQVLRVSRSLQRTIHLMLTVQAKFQLHHHAWFCIDMCS